MNKLLKQDQPAPEMEASRAFGCVKNVQTFHKFWDFVTDSKKTTDEPFDLSKRVYGKF